MLLELKPRAISYEEVIQREKQAKQIKAYRKLEEKKRLLRKARKKARKHRRRVGK